MSSVLRALIRPPIARHHFGGGAYLDSPVDQFFAWRVGRLTFRLHTRGGVKFSLVRVTRSSWQCYCDYGGLMFECHLFGVARWFSVEWLTRPCPCDLVVAELESEE